MKKFKNIRKEDVTLEDIRDLIESDYEYEVFVGTDSQVHRKIRKVIYATCVILYMKGKGGKVFIAREKERYAESLRQRLMNETWRSLETAFELKELLPANVEIIIHVDVNKSRKHKSGSYMEELVGMVVGQGFKVVVKPDAWAAQHVADKFSR
jgi:predicted RNase H-related nuclease YkuK (DUF458 family)